MKHWVFFLTAAIIAVLGLVANMVIILNKGKREYLIVIFKRKLIKRSCRLHSFPDDLWKK